MTTPEARAALAAALRQSMGLGPDDDMRQDFGDIDGGRLLRPSEAASAILAALAASGWTVVPATPEHAAHPDEPHEFRTVCQRCGESGYLHVAVITDLEVVKVEPRP